MNGMQYEKKRFSVYSQGTPVAHNVMSDEDRARLEKDTANVSQNASKAGLKAIIRKIVPFGDRILVQRIKVGQTLGSGILIAPDHTADNETELAEVVYIPDATVIDSTMVSHADEIIESLTKKAMEGDSTAIVALHSFNKYLNIRRLKIGDRIFMSRYAGTNFSVQETGQKLTLVDYEGIIGLVVEK